MGIMDNIRNAVEEGKPGIVTRLLSKAIDSDINPQIILKEALLPAMRKMGQEYKEEDSDVARILAAARAMKKGMDFLEPYLDGSYFGTLGKVILGTAGGDLHDLGKNLVAIMFRSVGFEVIDLGVDVSAMRFIKAVKEHPDVNIVCVSSLLTTSMPEMKHIVHELNELHSRKNFKVMVGGGPVTEAFAKKIGADGYTDNAASAAQIARKFIENEKENK